MKITALILLSGLSLSPFLARAEQIESDPMNGPSQDLRNLIYYPHAQKFAVVSAFHGTLANSGRSQNVAGVDTHVSDDRSYSLTVGMSYGIIDRLRVNIAESELFDESSASENTANNSTTSNQSRGPSNPTIGVSYRIIESDESQFLLDSALSVTPAIGHRKAVGPGQSGNNNGDPATANFILPAYWISKGNEAGFSLEVLRNFGGTASAQDPNNASRSSAYLQESINLQDRLHFSSRAFAQPNLQFVFPYVYHSSSQASAAIDTQHTVKFHVVPSLNIGYLVARWCLLTANVAYNSTDNLASDSTGKSTEFTTAETTAFIQGLYQF